MQYLKVMATATAAITAAFTGLTTAASASTIISQGFETNTAGWNNVTRVASGTDGVISSEGNYHATVGTDSTVSYYTTNGSYADVPVPYSTSLDIYLNVNGGYANNTRFDYDAALSKVDGTHLQDFIFNAGFYNDSNTGPSGGVNRFVISASNNSQPSSAYPANPGRNPIAITQTGWYTFTHSFYNDGGYIAALMTITNSSGTNVGSFTLGGQSDPQHLFSEVGGDRYNWIDFNQVSNLAIDNYSETTPSTVPLPAGMPLMLGGLGALGLLRRRRRRNAA